MKRWIVLLTVLLLLGACVALPDEGTATPVALVVASARPVLTSTVTATAEPSVTPTASPTATPEPPAGSLVVVIGHEVRVMAADGSAARVLLSKEAFEAQFPVDGDAQSVPYWSGLLSPDGKSLLVFTCAQFSFDCNNKRLYVSRLDLSQTSVIKTFSGGLLMWAPTSDKFMMQYATDERNKIVVTAGLGEKGSYGKTNNLPASEAAFWSFDGSQVYYYDNKSWSVVNSDGSSKRTLKCEQCPIAPDPHSYAVAQSPDGARIAIGYLDGTIVIASSDLTSYTIGKVGGYVNKLLWSPDSAWVAVDVRTSSNQSDVSILNASALPIGNLARPEGAKFMNACAWSPDSQNLAYLTLGDGGNEIYLQPMTQPEPIHFLSLQNEIGTCPVWLQEKP